MAFCKFSSEAQSSNFTSVDNAFFEHYLPFASGEQVRVYLYGLYLCTRDNLLKSELSTLDTFAQSLGLSKSEVMDAFSYFEQLGLVQIVDTTPPEVLFLPVRSAIPKRKFATGKYDQFNLQAQSILSERMLTTNEFAEYYTLLESFNMAPEALLMVMQYCADLKGKNVGYAYILTVAKNWVREGILTMQQVEKKLSEFNETDAAIRETMKALGSSRAASVEERQQYIRWVKEFGFSKDIILAIAKKVQKGGFSKLDYRLSKYFQLHLTTLQEMEEFEKNKEALFSIAREITKILGVYYQNLDNVIESYISPWLQRGYNEATLRIIATYSFKNSIRTLEGMDGVVQRFYKNGLTTLEAIAQFVEKMRGQDALIQSVLEKAGLLRSVTSWDREFYKTWSYSWNMPQEVIEHAATMAGDKTSPMQYVNKILSNWFEQKIFTLDEAKLAGDLFKAGAGVEGSKDSTVLHTRKYTQDELESLIRDIDEIEI